MSTKFTDTASGTASRGVRSRVACLAFGAVSVFVSCMLFSPKVLAQEPLTVPQILDLTGKFVQGSAQHLGKVVCVESVSQAKLNPDGKVIDKQERTFDYQIQVDVKGNDLLVHESVTPQTPPKKSKHVPLLVTEGFSTILLIFHPMYPQDFEYVVAPANGGSSPGVVVVHFQHVHGTPSPSVLRLRGSDYPLDLQGAAWIDESSGAIERVVTDLEAPVNEVGLSVFHSDVSYVPNHFSGNPNTHWLPVTAEMDAESPHQHWQNFYRFTDYRTFSANMEIEFQKQPLACLLRIGQLLCGLRKHRSGAIASCFTSQPGARSSFAC
ncbi:MAG TPA: hypothetical protein VJN21_10855 [Candidatus Acidoferrales bacterium]|nr:hypothetical protein [Candidatus Acidoferrales bacterium]